MDRSYDAAGNLDAVKRDGTTVADYSYDSRNQVTGSTFGNGVELTNQHDNLGRMAERQYNNDGNMVAGFSYGYDEVGNKLYQEDLRDTDQSELYGYDNRDRLTDWERGELNADKDDIVTTEVDQTWTLDPVGNWDLTTTDGTADDRDHNDVNELIHRENGIAADLRYDDNGNLIEDIEYEYAYDPFNRLVEVADKETGDTIATYRYDTENRRVVRIVENTGNLNGTTQYVYDGWQVVEERDGGGQLERIYTYGNYIDEPITLTAGGNTYYYHTNNLYNVRALTDENGAVVERYRYTAYGEVTIFDQNGHEIAESAVGNPYMFQGRRLDAETELYYYRNRMMSAELGRFLQRDPLGYVDGYNLYEYVESQPVRGTDPSGKSWIPFWGNDNNSGDNEVVETSCEPWRFLGQSASCEGIVGGDTGQVCTNIECKYLRVCTDITKCDGVIIKQERRVETKDKIAGVPQRSCGGSVRCVEYEIPIVIPLPFGQAIALPISIVQECGWAWGAVNNPENTKSALEQRCRSRMPENN